MDILVNIIAAGVIIFILFMAIRSMYKKKKAGGSCGCGCGCSGCSESASCGTADTESK